MNLHNLVAYGVSVMRYEGKMPLGKTGRRWMHNIKLIFKEWNEKVDWIDLAQDRRMWWALMNSRMNLPIP
jgi:hypothetical protein